MTAVTKKYTYINFVYIYDFMYYVFYVLYRKRRLKMYNQSIIYLWKSSLYSDHDYTMFYIVVLLSFAGIDTSKAMLL